MSGILRKQTFKSLKGRRSTPIVNKIASIKYQQSSANDYFHEEIEDQEKSYELSEDEIEEEDINDLENDDLIQDENDYLVAAFKRKRDNIGKDHKGNQEKKIHKSLRDNPWLIVTPALRKKKENELKANPTPKQTSSQIHPSIMWK